MFKPHYSPHYYFDNKIYFITSRIIDKSRFFNTKEKKSLFKKILIEAGNKFEIGFYA